MGVSFAAPRRIWADLLARTRIKICGLTREQDVRAAVDAGVDAVGFVFYPPSPRYVDARRAVALCALLPPFVTPVGLFVNADPAHVAAVLAEEARDRFNLGIGLVTEDDWPTVDPALLVDDEVTIAVQHKGKLRDTLSVAKGLPKDELEALALASEKVQRSIDGAEVRKVIVVPDRLVNIVT